MDGYRHIKKLQTTCYKNRMIKKYKYNSNNSNNNNSKYNNNKY